MNDLKRDVATVICPRFPIALEGLDFGDGNDGTRGDAKPIPGGFCVFAVDLPGSLERIASLRRGRGGPWPYLCSDLERGAGQQIAGLTRLPPAMALGAAGDASLAEAAGRLTAREARRAGIAVVFAPVVDLADEPRNPIVATRAFSADPEEVSVLAAAFIRGCQAEGVAATAKHFPGHGATTEDSHLKLPLLTRSREQLDSMEMKPFRAAIEAGARAVMIGHLHATAFDGDVPVPTSLSKATIDGGLRRGLGFQGAVFTDALDMGAIAPHASREDDPAAEPSVLALTAGADVALLPRDPHRAARAIVAAVEKGILPRARLAEAAERIRELAGGFSPPLRPELAPDPEGRALAMAIARASITIRPGDPRHSMRRPLAGRKAEVLVVDDGRGAQRLPVLLDALREAGVAATVAASGAPADGTPSLIAVFSDVRCNKGRVVLPPEQSRRIESAIAGARECFVLSIGCPQALAATSVAAPLLFAYDDDDASLLALAEVVSGRVQGVGAVGRMVFLPRALRAP